MYGHAVLRRLRYILLPLLCIFVTAASARAQRPKRVLVLPVVMTGHFAERDIWQRAFDERLSRSVDKFAYQEVRFKPGSEMACAGDACLEVLRNKYKTDGAIAAEVHATDSQPPDTTVRVLLFDPVTNQRVQAVQVGCNQCTELATAEKLYEVAMQTLSGKAPVNATHSLVPNTVTSAAKRSSNKRILFLTLGSVAAGGALASAIALGIKASQYGQPYCRDDFSANYGCPFKRDTSGAIIGASVATAGFLVLAGVSFGLAAKYKSRPAIAFVPGVHGWDGSLVWGGEF